MLIRDQLIKIFLFYTPVSLSNTFAGEFSKQKQLEMIIEYLTLHYSHLQGRGIYHKLKKIH